MDFYIGQIVLMAFGGRAPVDLLPCRGQTLQIQQYEALFTIIGTTYGGNGTSTFMLPDLTAPTPSNQQWPGSGSPAYYICTLGMYPEWA